jgi:hypothetical protein
MRAQVRVEAHALRDSRRKADALQTRGCIGKGGAAMLDRGVPHRKRRAK